ncbi:carbonic anhydrase family protein [Bdellovibrio svalbardensis]|uniref:Carbonic anhydrase family protein n=1 Tax=Bdellovibrio svalbardensis TaxID=2972972 RepID=A0ABT6DHD7_9BACT|nr:carbonic anhydrase family protein [Bdellovibrio svalbardensis]MDG0816265.1 carbonic anhydrase family protein [Bdellovibrio svalbardensis]
MKTLLASLVLASLLCSCSTTKPKAENTSAEVTPQAYISKEPATPQDELAALKDGNRRFLNNQQLGHDFHYQINKTKDGQKPYAVVLSCLDSRVPVEVVFDQGIGEVFVARVAGNIENNDILGSMEYGTAVVGAKLIVVMGHTKCGAVKGACDNVKLGHLTELLKKIEPAVKNVKSTTPNFNPESYEHVDHVSEENVRLTVGRIRKNSQIIRDLESQNKVRLVGAMYDISSGNVKFLED